MIVHTVSIPTITKDNDAAYLNHVRYTVETIDPNASIYISKSESILSFHVEPSSDTVRQALIDKLLEYHRALNIKIEFSKSLKIQKKISFKINFS
jgi:hypothetical protein